MALKLDPVRLLIADDVGIGKTTGAGSERKTTGSHYTPTPLVECLLDSALEPVIADRLERARQEYDKMTRGQDDKMNTSSSHLVTLSSLQEQAILSIKLLDFAVGSGHMLIGAGRRLARHLARIRTGDDEPAPEALRSAIRDVVGHCLYGVDLNDMAVELCKVALWMETLEPGKPLSFLDSHIQVGNSLIGVTPGLDISEIPDDAFQPKSGDDKPTASGLRRRNKKEREGQLGLFADQAEAISNKLAHRRAERMSELEQLSEDAVDQVQAKEDAYGAYLRSDEYKLGRWEYDLWTGAFFWPIPKDESGLLAAPTQEVLGDVRIGKLKRHAELLKRVRSIARQHQFFHWALQFPEVFNTGGRGWGVGRGASTPHPLPPTPHTPFPPSLAHPALTWC
jgi:hypothetical protein